ncbi:hypothetical protein LMG27174_01220 [Paraburkholderia rhynchosiae]|uniref:Uncharacterized protein n=1 Tax=Paraburkholderia rhynchosiae TaxID=487049 RepID=A0A6J5AMX8_9BURK|nr:hypothetical protein LMG27174_01220 [Paraburkholderia rhynchosiae]
MHRRFWVADKSTGWTERVKLFLAGREHDTAWKTFFGGPGSDTLVGNDGIHSLKNPIRTTPSSCITASCWLPPKVERVMPVMRRRSTSRGLWEAASATERACAAWRSTQVSPTDLSRQAQFYQASGSARSGSPRRILSLWRDCDRFRRCFERSNNQHTPNSHAEPPCRCDCRATSVVSILAMWQRF